MKLGIIGLGRMGGGIAERVLSARHQVVGFDLDETNRNLAHSFGVEVVSSIEDVAKQCRVIWLMVPPGKPVDQVIEKLLPHLQANDILIDGGNSNFHDSIRRSKEVAQNNVHYLDCGTSGGLNGKIQGYCLMIGGDKGAYDTIYDLLNAIAAPGGFGHMGPTGAGHYVKMVHNGIEYALLQGYAEGFQLLKEGSYKKDNLNLEEISRLWNHGSVIRSWLLDLAHNVFQKDQQLENISGEIAEGGTGKWTVEDAHKNNVPVPVIEKSLEVRAISRQTGGNYATKLIQMLRNQFGGHEVKKIG
jgi:6-phosphogluconate dehydrogenase